MVSTTYDGILIKWDTSFQESGSNGIELDDEKEYVLYFREDSHHHPIGHQTSNTMQEWNQKRIFAGKTNQFVLNKDNSQSRIKCGTKYHLYMTATNSLGTGEPSETVFARTKGDPPIAPNKSDFIKLNSTTAVLALKAWQPRGCPIVAFSIQYKPIHQKQWIPLAEHMEIDSRSRDFFYVNHLNPNRDYQLLVGAHSDAGITRQEYMFHTPNVSSAVIRMIGSPPHDPYNRLGVDGSSIASPNYSGSNSLFRNLTVLLPVMISLLVLIVILGTLFGCMRRQHVNHVVNGSVVDGHAGDGLCPEHLAGCLHNGKDASPMILDPRVGGIAGRRGSECYPLNEFRTPINGNANQSTCPSLNNSSCDSKSNLLNGTLANSNGDHLATLGTGTSPRHMIHSGNYVSEPTGNMNHFATLNCKKIKMLQDTSSSVNNSYYSSPQRKILISGLIGNGVCNGGTANGGNTRANLINADHEYAEPLQTMLNNRNTRCSVDLLLNDDVTKCDNINSNDGNNHCQLIGSQNGDNGPNPNVPLIPVITSSQSMLQSHDVNTQSNGTTNCLPSYATINKKNMSSMAPYL